MSVCESANMQKKIGQKIRFSSFPCKHWYYRFGIFGYSERKKKLRAPYAIVAAVQMESVHDFRIFSDLGSLACNMASKSWTGTFENNRLPTKHSPPITIICLSITSGVHNSDRKPEHWLADLGNRKARPLSIYFKKPSIEASATCTWTESLKYQSYLHRLAWVLYYVISCFHNWLVP
jgi:hypothetical protein